MAEDTHDFVKHWENIQQTLRGYRRAQVLISATKLGVFRELADGPLAVEELARKIDADPDGLQRLLAAAVGMGLLHAEEGRYANAPIAAACLAREGRFYMGNLVALEGAFYGRWNFLTEAVRSGKQPQIDAPEDEDSNWVRSFELALMDLARVSAPAIAELLPVPQEGPAHVLDVGGGHGAYSMALARRYPNVEATVLELPAAAEVARDIISGEGMSERVKVRSGNFQEDELGSDFDLVLLFGVLGSESAEGQRALLRKVHAALKAGGAVAIRGFAYGEKPYDLEEALFSLHLLLSTSAGDSPTLETLQEALQETGFAESRLVSVEAWIGSRLLVAGKPESGD